MSTDRQASLVRAAMARAKITAFLNQAGVPLAKGKILPIVEDLDYDMVKLTNLLDRMATPEQGLLRKVNVEHDPGYRVAYTTNGIAGAVPEKEPAPEVHFRDTRPGKPRKEIPIDVKVNEKNNSITIRYAGLLVTISKEG